jgi:hypothetical protein
MTLRPEAAGAPLVLAVVLAVVLSVVPGLGGATAAQTSPPDDPVSARAYEVRYRSLSDAAELVGTLLSAQGELTLKPALRTLVVEDTQSVLQKVAAVLESYDLPPRRIEVTVNLFLGRREDEEGAPSGPGAASFSREVRGVIETLGDFTRWTSYEPLGSRSVVGVEGDELVASISADYLVAFTVESVHESGVIKFKRFSLQRIERDEDGEERHEDLYTAGMVVDAGDLTLLVAASGPDADRALFLALKAEPR